MNLKKLVTLLSMAFAAIALAAPASASAEPVFTSGGEPIEHEESVNAVFSGSFAWTLSGSEQGFHCSHVTAAITLEATGTGKVTSFETEQNGNTACTTTPDNFVVHTTATGLPWTIHTDGHDTIEITDVDIDKTVTHPATPHLVVAHRELTGDFHATIPAGLTNNIKTLNLSGEGTMHFFPGVVNAAVSGTLTKASPAGAIGTATVETR